MALYRARRPCVLYVEELGRTVDLNPGNVLDDDDPLDAAIIRRWGTTALRRDSAVEQATAAPGEQRQTRREAV